MAGISRGATHRLFFFLALFAFERVLSTLCVAHINKRCSEWVGTRSSFPLSLVNAALSDKMGSHRSVMANTISRAQPRVVVDYPVRTKGDVNTAAVCTTTTTTMLLLRRERERSEWCALVVGDVTQFSLGSRARARTPFEADTRPEGSGYREWEAAL